MPADALAKAWSTHWNVRLETVQTELVRVRRATVDYPAGHGKLQLDIQQEGTGTDPAPSMVVCALRDDSLGARNIKLTRTLVDRLVTDCWGPVLAGGEKKQITDWVLAGKGADVRHDFARFTVHRQIVPTSVRLEMISK